MERVVHLGVVWVYELTPNKTWFRYVKAFPGAITKKGEPDLDHESVQKYIREKHG